MTVQLVGTVIEVARRSAGEIATARKRVEMHLAQLSLEPPSDEMAVLQDLLTELGALERTTALAAQQLQATARRLRT
jgi:hypothetical protein